MATARAHTAVAPSAVADRMKARRLNVGISNHSPCTFAEPRRWRHDVQDPLRVHLKVPHFAHTGHTMPTRQRDGRLLAQHLELWQRVKDRQSAQSIGPHGTMAAKSGKPATGLLPGLLLCEDCGSRF